MWSQVWNLCVRLVSMASAVSDCSCRGKDWLHFFVSLNLDHKISLGQIKNLLNIKKISVHFTMYNWSTHCCVFYSISQVFLRLKTQSSSGVWVLCFPQFLFVNYKRIYPFFEAPAEASSISECIGGSLYAYVRR